MERVEASTQIVIRPLTRVEEFKEAIRIEEEVWGMPDPGMAILPMFVLASQIGGHVFGAYDGAQIVAFCLALPGVKQRGGIFLHSHMLAVRPEYRDRGIGRKLKQAQREEALARGIQLIEWTFDPLELKNAYFNVVRLGAIVRRYVFNKYGVTSSPLHGGLPTDRCVAEWWLAHPRVEALASGKDVDPPQAEARIAVPANIAELRHSQPEEARRIQASIGEQFSESFERRLAVIGFERSTEAGTYLLGRWHSL